jgi:hypothetical protein
VSIKQTLILAVVLLLLGGYILFLHLTKPEVQKEERPEIWSVEEEKIHHIEILLPREKKRIAFFQDKDEKWRFDDETKHPVDMKRWGGIVLLVSGPKSKRQIAARVDNAAEYGFTDPQMVVVLGVEGLKEPLEILFGDQTPNKDQYYVKLRHSDPLYIIYTIYCDVLMRLVREPPIPPLIKARALKKAEEKAQ